MKVYAQWAWVCIAEHYRQGLSEASGCKTPPKRLGVKIRGAAAGYSVPRHHETSCVASGGGKPCSGLAARRAPRPNFTHDLLSRAICEHTRQRSRIPPSTPCVNYNHQVDSLAHSMRRTAPAYFRQDTTRLRVKYRDLAYRRVGRTGVLAVERGNFTHPAACPYGWSGVVRVALLGYSSAPP